MPETRHEVGRTPAPSLGGAAVAEATPRTRLAVVVPAFNEAESLPELVERIAGVVEPLGWSYEVWLVDDGSVDGSDRVIADLAARRPEVRGLSLSRNYGKAAALAAGFAAVAADWVITMDADLQDDPEEIPRLVEKLEEGYDLVSGWKQARKDSFVKNQTSRLFNRVTGAMCGLRLHDFNCGLKAYRGEVTRWVRLYGEMHRYVPAMAHLAGFRVTELPVRHHARKYGRTKYGMNRFLNGFLDLLTVYFLHARGSSPLHFFGRLGAWLFAGGGAISLYFLGIWLLGQGLRVRPMLVLGLVLIVLAVQFVSLGLVAELIVAGRKPERTYRVRNRY
ncbi:MAG: glycosyltransferase family 2 protein [Candidatus Krumholzibacteriia bacterium]